MESSLDIDIAEIAPPHRTKELPIADLQLPVQPLSSAEPNSWLGVNGCNLISICQIVVILIVVVTSAVNLSLFTKNSDSDSCKVWIALLSSSIGYLLPNPKLKGVSKLK